MCLPRHPAVAYLCLVRCLCVCSLICACSVALFSACKPAIESKLVGSWRGENPSERAQGNSTSIILQRSSEHVLPCCPKLSISAARSKKRLTITSRSYRSATRKKSQLRPANTCSTFLMRVARSWRKKSHSFCRFESSPPLRIAATPSLLEAG